MTRYNKNIFLFPEQAFFYHYIGVNETFLATTDWCLCVSISFIILLSHNSDDVTGLFSRKHCTLPTTLEIGKIHNSLHFPKYKFTENILQKTMEVAFPRP